MSTPLTGRRQVQNTLACLLSLLYFVLLFSAASCVPYQVYSIPTAAPREIKQHHRRAEQARRHRVRQHPLPRPNPEWRQRPYRP